MSTEEKGNYFINEIPEDTGFGLIQHCKISIADIFPDKFYEITNSYIQKIQGVLCRYDAVIFMARKAISFYKALILNEQLVKITSCEIYSSRILKYNVWKMLQNKKVALVDDVVIRGSSLAEATKILTEHNISFDIYIAAWMNQDNSESSANVEKLFPQIIERIQKPFVYLNEVDIYSYTNYITRYMEASMLPYNIDQTMVLIEYDREQLDDFDCDHRITDITSSIQKKYGIENKVIHYKGEILRNVLGSINLKLEDVAIKIRIFRDMDSNEMLLFPIMLFPDISSDTLNHVYRHIETDKLEKLIWNENPLLVEENKASILMYVLNHYILSRFLWCEKEHGRKFKYIWVDSNEKVLFSKSILTQDFIKNVLNKKISKLRMPYKYEQRTYIRPMFFNEYLGAAYVIIFAGMNSIEYNGNTKVYKNGTGKKIERKIITFYDLYARLKNYAASKQMVIDEEGDLGEIDHVDMCIVSNIIDVLIDRGILVPEIVHTSNGSIIRAYRCGEVAKLTHKEFELFSYMLSHYAGHVWDNEEVVEIDAELPKCIGKREAEQLCVLFFRKAAELGLFEKVYDIVEKNYDDDHYSVYYSLYGPTVSRVIGRRYEVNKDETFVDALVSYGYIQEKNQDEYMIGNVESKMLTISWRRAAHNFANEMLFLKKCFPSRVERENFFKLKNNNLLLSEEDKLKRSVLSRVRSFEQLLTIMSIGENEMQRTLSIVADLKVIADMKTERVSAAMAYIKNHMNCIGEGIWKSRCFVNDELLEDIQRMLIQNRSFRDKNDISRIFQDYVDASSQVDRNSVIVEFLEQCSEFFYKTYYTVHNINECMCKDIFIEEKFSIPKRIAYEKRYKKLRQKIKSECSKCSNEGKEKKAIEGLQKLQREAMAMLDICDLYFMKKAFYYSPCYHSLIICVDNPDIMKKIRTNSSAYNYNQSKVGKLSDNEFFCCYLLMTKEKNDKGELAKVLKQNIECIVRSIFDNELFDESITIICYEAQNWYEALLRSSDTVTGKFVEKIVKDIFELEKKRERNSNLELFISGTLENVEWELASQYYRIQNKGLEDIVQKTCPIKNYSIQITMPRKREGSIIVEGNVNGNLINEVYGSDIIGIEKR